jgi:hypothetical protein
MSRSSVLFMAMFAAHCAPPTPDSLPAEAQGPPGCRAVSQADLFSGRPTSTEVACLPASTSFKVHLQIDGTALGSPVATGRTDAHGDANVSWDVPAWIASDTPVSVSVRWGRSQLSAAGTIQGDFDGDGVAATCGDCDDDNPSVHPGALEGCSRTDLDCDGQVPAPLLEEDLEDGIAAGTLIAGHGCWICTQGGCTEVYATSEVFEGASSLYTNGSNNAGLYCVDASLEQDFSYSSWFYDDMSGGELTVLFSQTPSYQPDMDSFFVGFDDSWCDATRYCTRDFDQGNVQHLGSRSLGWHRTQVFATYQGSDVTWTACIDDVCSSPETSPGPLVAFRLHHDATIGWMDELLTCAP